MRLVVIRRLKRFAELFLGDAGFPDEGAERGFGQLAVIGHGQPAAGWLAQNDVAAGLVIHFVTVLSEGLTTSAPEQTGRRLIPRLRRFPRQPGREPVRCAFGGYGGNLEWHLEYS